MADQLATDIIDKIKAQAGPESQEITLDTDLDELGIHSLELTEIVFDLEEAYDIEIDMNTVEAWNKLKNVGDIVEADARPDRRQGGLGNHRAAWPASVSSSPASAAFAASAPTFRRSGTRCKAGVPRIGEMTTIPLDGLKIRIGGRDQGSFPRSASTAAGWRRWTATACSR